MKGTGINEKKMKKALIKRALGYDAEEVIEEYVKGEDGVVLAKKKVTIKNVPPDVSALKALLELNEKNDITSMTEEQRVLEKQRLLDELYSMNQKEEENCKKNKKSKEQKNNSTKI